MSEHTAESTIAEHQAAVMARLGIDQRVIDGYVLPPGESRD